MVQVLTKQQKRKEHYILIPLKISKEVFKFLDKCKTPNKYVLALQGATAYCQALSLSLKSKSLGVLSKTRATTAPLGWVTTQYLQANWDTLEPGADAYRRPI